MNTSYWYVDIFGIHLKDHCDKLLRLEHTTSWLLNALTLNLERNVNSKVKCRLLRCMLEWEYGQYVNTLGNRM